MGFKYSERLQLYMPKVGSAGHEKNKDIKSSFHVLQVVVSGIIKARRRPCQPAAYLHATDICQPGNQEPLLNIPRRFPPFMLLGVGTHINPSCCCGRPFVLPISLNQNHYYESAVQLISKTNNDSAKSYMAADRMLKRCICNFSIKC